MKKFIAIIIGAILGALLWAGCNTIIPEKVEAAAASWDGTNQNSGFICFTNGGAYITPHAADRYRDLAVTYGKEFNPALEPGAGLQPTNGVFYIDAEHLSKFGIMSIWRREGKPPLK